MKSHTCPMIRCASRALLLLLALPGAGSFGQETQYISDMVLVPVRSGAGANYRIVNRGLPSGTALLVFDQSEDGEWAEIETRGGTRGWIPTQYLQKDPPAGLLINDLRLELEQVGAARPGRQPAQSELSQASEAMRRSLSSSRRWIVRKPN